MAIYPKELTELVEVYLADGVISPQERMVLLAKAQNMGIDSMEFGLYIDAQQQLVGQTKEPEVAKKSGSTCPYCGKNVPDLTEKCPYCDSLITAQASEELQEILDTLEESLVNFKANYENSTNKAIVERYVRKAEMYYKNNPKVQLLLNEIRKETSKVSAYSSVAKLAEKLQELSEKESEKSSGLLGVIGSFYGKTLSSAVGVKSPQATCIENFPVPNEREDLLQFLTSIQSKAKKPTFFTKGSAQYAIEHAYWALYSNCINKARISFSGDPDFQFFFDDFKKR